MANCNDTVLTHLDGGPRKAVDMLFRVALQFLL